VLFISLVVQTPEGLSHVLDFTVNSKTYLNVSIVITIPLHTYREINQSKLMFEQSKLCSISYSAIPFYCL